MYRVSSSVRRHALALLGGIATATAWVNLSPASYYDTVEARLAELALPGWIASLPVAITPMTLVSNALMPLFLFFLAKELWEALALERSPLRGRDRGALPLGAVLGGMVGAALVWLLVSGMIETAEEARFGTGWPVPLGSDAVLAYLVGRRVFGAGHPALHLLLLIAIGQDILGLLVLGLAVPVRELVPGWLILPLVATIGVWTLFGRRARVGATEVDHRAAFALWPYVLAGGLCWLGVALSGLPPALGLLPMIPVIPHAERSFGVFAEAEVLLHDPLNRLVKGLARVVPAVLFAFGLTRGGIDLGAWAPATGSMLAALWIGKPLGVVAGGLAGLAFGRTGLPSGLSLRDLCLIAVILGMGFTVPALAIDAALPGGGMAEAARLGLALSLAAGLVAPGLARLWRRQTLPQKF